MKKNYLIFVEHILDSLKNIELFMKNVKKENFFKDKEKQSAVIRQIEIMGEATKNLPVSFRKQYSQISWKKITGARDKLIHHYFGVDLDTIWDIVKEDLLILKVQIEKILEQKD
ncbi:MAG: DUF86 domain-containing protein [Nanoarchaeota archaeon]|nr:DUF86 domain-containing protein [Nanoarchaeota archaeon]